MKAEEGVGMIPKKVNDLSRSFKERRCLHLLVYIQSPTEGESKKVKHEIKVCMRMVCGEVVIAKVESVFSP